MSSLQKEIANLSDPTPIFDPEDDIDLDSAPSIFSKQTDDDAANEFTKPDVCLKTRNAPLLESIDPKYAGKKISRRALESGFQADNDKSEISFESDLESFEDNASSVEMGTENSEAEEDISEIEETSDAEIAENEETSDSDVVETESSQSSVVAQFSNFDMSEEIEKGNAVKNQKEVYSRLLEARIKLQKLLILANKQPQKDAWKRIIRHGGSKMTESLNKGIKSTRSLLSSLSELHSVLVDQNMELTGTSLEKSSELVNSDEEIPSESDEEIPSESDEEIPKVAMKSEPEMKTLKRKLEIKDYDKMLAKRFKDLIPHRNSIIQKWDEKTRLSTGRMTQKSFAAFDNSALKQIELVLQDRNRLIKRTRMKRSLYRVLGTSDALERGKVANENPEEMSKQDLLLRDWDPEIFDDDDFYRQLLKEVIENKSFGLDPAVIRKQMEIQKIRNKMKKKVDTKASKGRKLRYDIHSKLLNFMPPLPISSLPDEARNNLLKSLFGKAYLK